MLIHNILGLALVALNAVEPYCPFCFVKLNTGPPYCEHLIVDITPMGSEAPSVGRSPFDDTMLTNAIDKWYAKLSASTESGDWSMQQKETAFGPLLLSYEAFAEPGNRDGITDLLEAMPTVGEVRRVCYMWENWGYPGAAYFYAKGFFCDKPEIAQSYYKEQAANFVAGLNALAEMEPENMNNGH